MRKKVTAILLVLIFVLSAAFTAIPAAAAQVTEVGDTAAGSMTLNRTSLSMGLSEDYTLRVSGTDAPVSWRSSSNAVFVEANSDGSAKITAINVGETTVTATAGGEQISCKVSVLPMAEKLELNETSLLLGVGEEFDLDSAVPDGTEAYYRMYSSSDKSVATVAAGGGIVTAKAPGRATITCTLDNGVKARCSVVVRPMAQSLTLNYSKVTLNIGEQVDLDSSAPSGTAAYYRAYTIDNTAVADVAISGGIVTAKSAGTATVTCTLTQNGVKVYCEIEVLPDPTEDVTEAPTEDLIEASTEVVTEPATESATEPVTEPATEIPEDQSFALDTDALTLGIGEEYTVTASGTSSDVSWNTSSDSIILTDNGARTATVKAAAAGEATVTAVTAKGSTAKAVFTVKPMADAIGLNETELTLGVGEKFDLDSYAPSGMAAYYRLYHSSNPAVASVVQGGGLVTAKSAGSATIYCIMQNGAGAKCTVTVKPLSTKLYLNQTEITLAVGEEYDLDSYAAAGMGAYYRIYSSSNTSVATVASGGGLVKAKSTGTTNIYCTLQNGVRAKCVVTVKPMAKSLYLDDTYVRLKKGGKWDLDSYVPSGYAAFYRFYSSDNPSVAKVERSGGLITAVAPGKATVTCTLENGVTATCEVRVMTDADARNDRNGTIINFHDHDNFSGEDVWGKGTLEASVVDWMMATWPCCSYFNGDYTWRCAEWGRYIRNTRAASQTTTDYSSLRMTPENIRSIAKGCKPGTTMSFGPQYIPSHMIVLLRVTDDRIWWADCNWNWDNCVHYREASLEEFVNFVHWLPTPNKNGYIVSITRINRLNTYDNPKTDTARYQNRGDARIVWTAVDGAKSYEVYQVTGSGDKLVYSGTAVSYTNYNSTPGTKYTYYVKAVMGSGRKITGNTVSVYGRIHCPLLELDRDHECIRWNAVEGASGYRIFRRYGNDGEFRHITTVKGTSYSDGWMDWEAGEYDYTLYRIQAVSPKGENASSVYSDCVAVSGEYCMP